MSNRLISAVYDRQVGNLTRTAILALLADRANDQGGGIWASKQFLAEALGTSKQTVIRTIQSLLADGVLREIGHRRCNNGFTVEYAIAVDVLMSLPYVPSRRKNPSNRLTGQGELPVNENYRTGNRALPDQSSSMTGPVTESDSNPPEPNRTSLNLKGDASRAKRSSKKLAMTEHWLPAPLPSQLRDLVDQWPRGRFEREVAEFRDYWLERGDKRPGWDRTFRSHINAIHDRVMRDSGNRRGKLNEQVNGSSAYLDALNRRLDRQGVIDGECGA